MKTSLMAVERTTTRPSIVSTSASSCIRNSASLRPIFPHQILPDVLNCEMTISSPAGCLSPGSLEGKPTTVDLFTKREAASLLFLSPITVRSVSAVDHWCNVTRSSQSLVGSLRSVDGVGENFLCGVAKFELAWFYGHREFITGSL